jgi:PIN domain nuclease of toxin-antitoxin system
MRILLDTNVFLWLLVDDPRLSQNCKNVFLEKTTEALLSMASVWEMFIKHRIGKLSLQGNPSTFIREQLDLNGISLLPIHYAHLAGIIELPMIHKDPFDRLIIAQALHEKIPMLSSDSVFTEYGVKNLY